MLKIHQYHLSPYNEKVQRALNFKGIPFEEKYWGLTEQKQVKAINPSGKLPALEHDDTLVVDSTDIVHYLEKAFPERPLLPADPKLRGMVHVLEDWADESLYFYEMHCRFGTPGNRERNLPRLLERESGFFAWLLLKLAPKGLAKITSAQGVGRKSMEQLETDCRRHVTAVSEMLGQDDWLVNNQTTLADLAVYSMFQTFRDADFLAAILNEHPNVCAWMQRIEDTTSTRAP